MLPRHIILLCVLRKRRICCGQAVFWQEEPNIGFVSTSNASIEPDMFILAKYFFSHHSKYFKIRKQEKQNRAYTLKKQQG